MKRTRKIHNLDTLEKEIYRLQLEAKNTEEKLDRNFDHLRDNYSSMFMNSFFSSRRNKEEGRSSFFDSFFKNENFTAAINKVTDHIANRAAEGIENLVDKIFQKKK
ncbi:MAG TPA: hypothetical protein VIZ28_12555 [Chitinophagaceae bacterium]